MPIYEYSCSECGKITDVLQKMSDPAPTRCESCGKENTLTRVVSRTSFVLKGGGWYADLYGSSKKPEGGSSDKAAGASSTTTAAPSTSSSAAPSAASTTTASTPAATTVAPAVKK